MAKLKLNRRKFILALGAGSAAGAAAIAVKALPTAAPEPQAPTETHKGYKLSEHVRKYYRTTLV